MDDSGEERAGQSEAERVLGKELREERDLCRWLKAFSNGSVVCHRHFQAKCPKSEHMILQARTLSFHMFAFLYPTSGMDVRVRVCVRERELMGGNERVQRSPEEAVIA